MRNLRVSSKYRKANVDCLKENDAAHGACPGRTVGRPERLRFVSKTVGWISRKKKCTGESKAKSKQRENESVTGSLVKKRRRDQSHAED